MKGEELIRHCFEEHLNRFGGRIKFAYEQYREFWLLHKVGDVYRLKHRNGKYDLCRVAYYPLPDYDDLRALVELEEKKDGGIDLRDVPVHFLEKQTTQQKSENEEAS